MEALLQLYMFQLTDSVATGSFSSDLIAGSLGLENRPAVKDINITISTADFQVQLGK